jgi:hypothetical protein
VAIHIPTLDDVRSVLDRDGKHPVLLYIDARKKYPSFTGWENVTYEQTQTQIYQEYLRRFSNTGVLLGGADSLCAFDCDTEFFLAEFVQLNPGLASTLTSVGERGAQFWSYVTGVRPQKVEHLKVRPESPLATGAKKIESDGTVKVGEFRAEGGQSVIRGIHPCGTLYKWFCPDPPITIAFDQVKWPGDIIIPWSKDYRKHQESVGSATDDGLLQRAIAILSIDKLWDQFGYPTRNGNPVCSPFREDRSPSFSVYDEGRRFKDHGDGSRGDSFDFYQRAKGQDAKTAFVGFVELAGLGAELKKNKPSPSPAAGGPIDNDLLQKLAIYYDPERSCWWKKNDRDNWIKLSASDIERHLAESGFNPRPPKGATVSETDRILNAIQVSKDIEYAGSLAGYSKGILEFAGKRFLILDSPKPVEPCKGDWSTLGKFLLNLLEDEQLAVFNGWVKVALEALRDDVRRPGQALVFTGEKDCGKSLLQKLITVLLGGRMAKPYLYMSGQTSFNGNLFGSEHLSIEDEVPYTDIKSRRNFGAKIKEITAIDEQNCHIKFRNGITLPVFWRLTISVNDETENLLILPPFDDSIEDKLILFKVAKRAMPMPTATNQERAAFWEKLASELPAYVEYLFNSWKINKLLVSQRYGVTHYQNPDILEQLGELAPETRLLQLIDAEIFKPVLPTGRPTNPWQGTAIELEQRLTSYPSDVVLQARELLSWQGASGTYLGRLRKTQPKRISYQKTRTDRIWTIVSPA